MGDQQSPEDDAPVFTAHELARRLLAAPDIEVWISTECCGCFVEVGGCTTSRYGESGNWTDCVVITDDRPPQGDGEPCGHEGRALDSRGWLGVRRLFESGAR